MKHNFKKQFGQNFLKNINFIIKIIEELGIEEGDKIIEVGPGDGRLTEYLVNEPIELRAIEIDEELIPILQSRFGHYKNFKLIHQDILKISKDQFQIQSYKVTGNLPYNISKPIIKKFIEADEKPEIMVFTLQKEVAQDYASFGGKASFLSNLAQIFYEVKYISTIPKEFFVPKPKVDGGIIKFSKKTNPQIRSNQYRDFVKFLKNGFRSQRKQLKGVLKSIYKEIDWQEVFEKNNIKLTTRASELEYKDFVNLFTALEQTYKSQA